MPACMEQFKARSSGQFKAHAQVGAITLNISTYAL